MLNCFTIYLERNTQNDMHYQEATFLYLTQGIKRVDVWKVPRLTKQMQVRIGDTDNSRFDVLAHLTSNTICDDTKPTQLDKFPYSSFVCSTLLSGRFLTVQTLGGGYLELSEVDVFTLGTSIL